MSVDFVFVQAHAAIVPTLIYYEGKDEHIEAKLVSELQRTAAAKDSEIQELKSGQA